jgi:hypothetical protein
MPFYSRDKNGEWKLLKGEVPLYSRNGEEEKKMMAVLAPFDDEGLAMHVKVVEPDSTVIVYGPGFRKLSHDEAIVRQGDFFLQNRKTLRITLVIFTKEMKGVKPPKRLPKAEKVSAPHKTPDDPISLQE